MTSTTLPYRILARSAVAMAPWAARLVPGWRNGHRSRVEAADRIVRWASLRDRGGPVIWFHAASAGESLQAGAVRELLERRHPAWQFMVTWTSPSASRVDAPGPRTYGDYLPYDLPRTAGRTLDAVRPDLLVFTAADLWMEHALQAARREIPVALIAGAVRPGSSRLHWPGRTLLTPGYRSLSLAVAVDEEDIPRLEYLGVPGDVIRVAGDPRYDSVLTRIAGIRAALPPLAPPWDTRLLVAGSTWDQDHRLVLGAFALVRRVVPEARLLLVPHEPSERVFGQIGNHARSLQLPVPERTREMSRLAPNQGHESLSGELFVWDQVGMLAQLYRHGSLAWVGGGFRRAGLHSVLEPAGWGVPVSFGLRGAVPRDARRLIDAGGGFALGDPGTGPEVLAAWWIRFLKDEGARATAGAAAGRVVEENGGAAERTATLLERMVRD